MSTPLTQMELLDPTRHGHLRLKPSGGTKPHFVQIVVSEFAAAAASCPILFTKEATSGKFFAGAMFAFQSGENFLRDAVERGEFTPLSLQRDGFFIAGEHIAIDRLNPRFSETEGDPLFDGTQQPGIALRRIQRTLGHLKAGIEATANFIRALADLKLIEAIDVSLSFDSGGEKMVLQGLYTVSLDGIRTLGDAAALRLLRSGYLQLAYTMNTSLGQLPVLARLRDQAIRRTVA